MGKMSELATDIQNMRDNGFNDVQIAKILNIPLSVIPEQDDEVISYEDLEYV